ncbi:hypothetical protein ABZ568_23570 [Streptomyces olindensis]|uniref:Tetratricopeptide repeat protein n=1 Tax=Streptomyces olindensis TaxID=358823 RepID=A0ABV2XZ82_9ACTN
MVERQGQAAPDAVLTRIGQVVMLHHAGDREEARHRFLDLWAEIGEHGDPLHRCTLAHYLADTQDDPADELAWDLRALTAAEEIAEDGLGARDGAAVRDRAAARDTAAAVRAFYPALHVSLAADYAGLGDRDAARTHLRRARGAAAALTDDGYAAGVWAAIRRLESRLGEGGGETGGGPWGRPPRQRP